MMKNERLKTAQQSHISICIHFSKDNLKRKLSGKERDIFRSIKQNKWDKSHKTLTMNALVIKQRPSSQ